MEVSFDAAKSERNGIEWGLPFTRVEHVVFTPRADKVHVISLRKANQREVKIYAKNA
ncbi:MAG: BrnT family toxin [Rugosibacter sp.]